MCPFYSAEVNQDCRKEVNKLGGCGLGGKRELWGAWEGHFKFQSSFLREFEKLWPQEGSKLLNLVILVARLIIEKSY